MQPPSFRRQHLIIAAIVVSLLLAWIVMRMPDSSPHMRGKQLFGELGCSGCHAPGSAQILVNPGSLRGVIPGFDGSSSSGLFWVKDREEFEQWVRQGASAHVSEERQRFGVQPAQAIHMPAYGRGVSEAELDDLYTYYRDTSQPRLPPTDSAAGRGLQLAARQGCFGCHGSYGLEGSLNPGSFKGYIPSWEGEDFDALARSDDEIREWIQTGSLKRLSYHPVARFFLFRQRIRMPAYGDSLSAAQIDDLVAYIRWLPGRAAEEPATRQLPLLETDYQRGQYLFNRSGCATCHKSFGVEGFVDHDQTAIVPMSRMAGRLRNLANILSSRETEKRFNDAALCKDYQAFAQEYQAVHKKIKEGVNDNPAQQMRMPAWHERANPDVLPDPDTDIDSIIQYLLGRDFINFDDRFESDAQFTIEIGRWQTKAQSCRPVMAAALSGDNAGRRQQILSRIQLLDSEHNAFDQIPVVGFFSNETHLYDVIGFVEDKELDIWLLRQFIKDIVPADQEHMLRRKVYPSLIRYFIAVDKSSSNYRSYFYVDRGTYDFDKPPGYFRHAYADADMKDCFSCHASGPRVLRPQEQEGIATLSATELERLKMFNRRISGYGVVSTNWPTGQSRPEKQSLEEYTGGDCQGCHGKGGIRAPILRFHKKSIRSLTASHERDNGYTDHLEGLSGQLTAMPRKGVLSIEEHRQLMEWVDRQ